MQRIISYDEIPNSDRTHSIYFRMETDPKLYMNLMSKGYKLINDIRKADENTIYVTRKRQELLCNRSFFKDITSEEYVFELKKRIQDSLEEKKIEKPQTTIFSYYDLIEHKYKIPFVLKNENINRGKEKFLIATEEDYENLINACKYLLNRKIMDFNFIITGNIEYNIDYDSYLNKNFTVQEYIHTPSEFNTSVRLLTSSSKDLLYGCLKYNESSNYTDDRTLIEYLLHDIYPLSSKSIVSNTAKGGKNIVVGEKKYNCCEKMLLDRHKINSDAFSSLVESAANVHEEYKSELGIICGFDFIYDTQKEKWYWLELHDKPLVQDYAEKQGLEYKTSEERTTVDGRVRATALALTLKKTRK